MFLSAGMEHIFNFFELLLYRFIDPFKVLESEFFLFDLGLQVIYLDFQWVHSLFLFSFDITIVR